MAKPGAETDGGVATKGDSAAMHYLAWIPGSSFGGCESYALAVALRVRQEGWRVTLVCSHRACAEEIRRRAPQLDTILIAVPPLPQGLPGRGKFLRVWESLCTHVVLLWKSPGVVHAALPWHVHSIGFIEACLSSRRPTVVTIQLSAPGSPPPQQYWEAFRRARHAGVRFSAVSEDGRRLLAAYYGWDPRDVCMIPNRPKLSGQTRMTMSRTAMLSAAGIPPDARIVFTAAHLHYQKGYDLIVRAAPAILERFPGTVFVWAGEGPERVALERLIQEHQLAGAIRLLGWRNDVPVWLALAEVFLLPTRYEGESFALMEAIAQRVPVAATTVSGIPELLRNGEEALLFPADDVPGLADAVTATLADPPAARRRAERAAARLAAYSHEHMLEDTLVLLRNAAESPVSHAT